MAYNEILHGKSNHPLYGRNGTILYSAPITMSVSVTVSWQDGNDLDTCAFYSHRPSNKMGFSYPYSIADTGDGFSATHGGDNTTGGPEVMSLAYSGPHGIAGKRFEVHVNWYNSGEGHSGGNAVITATDAEGNTFSRTISPAHTKSTAAQAGNPGCAIVFNRDGTIREIVAA
jgi:hypothetical protein